jgi:hypothetical protein
MSIKSPKLTLVLTGDIVVQEARLVQESRLIFLKPLIARFGIYYPCIFAMTLNVQLT